MHCLSRQKYAHGLCFVGFCCDRVLNNLPIPCRVMSLALWESQGCREHFGYRFLRAYCTGKSVVFDKIMYYGPVDLTMLNLATLALVSRASRHHSGYGLSQWGEALLCNAFSHEHSSYPERFLGCSSANQAIWRMWSTTSRESTKNSLHNHSTAKHNKPGCKLYGIYNRLSIFRGRIWHDVENLMTVRNQELCSDIQPTKDIHTSTLRAFVSFVSALEKGDRAISSV